MLLIMLQKGLQLGIIMLAPEDASHHQLSIKWCVSFRKGILTCPVHIFQRMVMGGRHSSRDQLR